MNDISIGHITTQNKESSAGSLSSTIYNNNPATSQEIYDAFNSFIISKDRNVFFKLATKVELYQRIRDLPGDIVECGVFKGTGMLLWLKLVELYNSNSIRKVIGFDHFNPPFVASLKPCDKTPMKEVLDRAKTTDLSLEAVSQSISNRAGIPSNKFILVKGDVSESSLEFIKNNVGFRIALLYLDLDVEEPTYNALSAFWELILPRGLVVFDEYAYHIWSESNAVDRFIKEKGVQLYIINSPAPTAYIIKP